MNQHDNLHDRLLDCALSEVAGGHAPPDLATRIPAAAENPVIPIKDTTMERSPRAWRRWFALAIAACLLVGAGFLLPAMQRARETALSTPRSNSIGLQGIIDDSQSAEKDRTTPPSDLYAWKETTNRRTKYTRESSLEVKEAEVVDQAFAFYREGQQGAQQAPVVAPQVGQQDAVVGKQWSFRSLQDSDGQGQQAPGQQLKVFFGEGGYAQNGNHYNHYFVERDSRHLEERNFDWPARQFDQLVDQLGVNPPQQRDASGEGPSLPGDQYTRIYENPFIETRGEQAVSTFSIDVDTASYANVRQFLQSGQLPPPDAVRLEELINYFDYQYEPPPADSETPFSAAMEVAGCPWEPKHRLVRIALQGRELEKSKRPVSNLVFLIDVSGSMNSPSKLPLVVEGMKQLVRELGENDRVAIVVYASSEGLVLPSTPGTEQATILGALDRLQAGGSTAGGAGIQLAYQMAEDNFVKGGVNRVILCTDGDFNVGVTSTADLERMVKQKAKDTKVFLSVLGFGRGNLNDAMMETISNRGNGNYHYVDNLTEARKVLVEEMTGTLVTIAKDVKIQVEFNLAQVAGYRLLGYENRMLRTKDFNDDTKDAGEIGAGHRVTALYEIVPAGEKVDVPPVDDLKYQREAQATETSNELLTLKLRYKQPDADTSTKLEFPLTDDGKAFSAASPDFKFAAAAASFGMLLRDSQHKGNATFDAVLEIATEGAKHDPNGYRVEFLELVRKAKSL